MQSCNESSPRQINVETLTAVPFTTPLDESDSEEILAEGAALPSSNFSGTYATLAQNLSLQGIASSTRLGDASGASSDSADSAKKTKEYSETVAKSYAALAEQKGWKNPDNTLFPISLNNLCNFLRVKMATNNSRSLDWYIGGLHRYQKNVLNIQNWDDVRRHPSVKELLSQLKAENKPRSGRESPPGTPEKGKRNKQTIDDNSCFESVKSTPEVGSISIDLSKPLSPIDSKISTESILEYRGPSLSSSKPLIDPFSSIKLDNENIIISQEYDSTVSKPNSAEKFDPMVVSNSDDDDLEISNARGGYIATPKRRRKDNDNLHEANQVDDDDEPESFKSRYEKALATLKIKYKNCCRYHPEGCFLLNNNRHFILNERLYRRWAALCASGDDINTNLLPSAPELDEFSEENAVQL
ncbi:16872_t:CDS:2 [Dentiscutata erythropus]|uniref:16872_t:CDS:1 n=1 Tax=Dentiscutata erythropus TaxID=1348616 RepID=A0A9N9P0T7_9GLOM|nr:16872_t:CDS:2 [Dentiscutata erythropus]